MRAHATAHTGVSVKRMRLPATIAAALLLAACGLAPPADSPTLYSRLGGEAVVKRVVA